MANRGHIRIKALTVIEGMILATEPKDEMLRACYRFAHIDVGHCNNPHPEWVEELDKTYRSLKEGGVI